MHFNKLYQSREANKLKKQAQKFWKISLFVKNADSNENKTVNSKTIFAKIVQFNG